MLDHHFPIFFGVAIKPGPPQTDKADKACQVWNCHFPQAHPWLASRRYARAWLVAGRFKNSRGLRHGSRCTACGEMIDFVSPSGRPKDRLDANKKRDRKRKLHICYSCLLHYFLKLKRHTNLRPTSDFFAFRLDLRRRWVSHWGAKVPWKSHTAGAGFMTPCRFWQGHVRWYWLPMATL